MLTPSKVKVNYTVGYISLLDLLYPIGTIYLTVGNDSPVTIFGGTWIKIENALLSASGTNYGIADATSGTSTISTAMMPSHTHTGPSHYHSVNLTAASAGAHEHGVHTRSNSTYKEQGFWKSNVGSGSGWQILCAGNSGSGGQLGYLYAGSAGAHTHTISGNTGSAGTGNTGATGSGSSFIPYHYKCKCLKTNSLENNSNILF